MIAIANQMVGHPLGFLQPALYKVGTSPNHQRDFHDILPPSKPLTTSPLPPQQDARPGWDPISGPGTPNAVNLLPDLILAAQ